MKIGYIYLYGEEWEKWKKHNRPLPEIIAELKEIGCDKIYMDAFIEENVIPEIERIDMKALLEKISGSAGNDEFELYLRGRVEKAMSDEELQSVVKKEINRIHKRNNR